MNKKTLPIIIRVICVLLCLQMILPSLAVSAFADEGGEVQLSAKPLSYLDNKTFFDFASVEQPVLDSVYAMAINLDTGNVMYEKNPDVLLFPASAVKLMTDRKRHV